MVKVYGVAAVVLVLLLGMAHTGDATCASPQFNAAAPTSTFGVGASPRAVAVGDLNGDGNPDLAVANYNSNNVSILLGTGAGGFGAATNFAVGTHPQSLGVGDFNADGKQDLAVANYASNNVSLLLGTGTGGFGAATNLAVTHPASIAVGDFNADGKMDLAVASGSTNVLILLGTGTGSFGTATNFAVVDAYFVAVGDFNADGNPDLAAEDYGGRQVSILLGTGTGSFGAATNFAAAGPGQSLGVPVVVGDFNADGKLDLAVASENTDSGTAKVSILLGSGTGSFGPPSNFALEGSSPQSVAVGDFNADGKPDLAVANFNVSILMGTGTGSFALANDFAVGNYPLSVAVGDFNADGKPDLATANAGSNDVSILMGTGTGSFGAATNFAAGYGPGSVAAGDLNADGKLDLVVSNSGSNDVSILLGTGTGSFGAATNFAAGTSPFSVALGDFNADGKLDVAVSNLNSNDVSMLLGTGTGSLGIATNFAVGTYPFSVVVGDFNADSRPDLAVANSTSNSVSILLGTGTGSFGAATNVVVGTNPASLAVGDFNTDGKPDLAVANNNSNNVSILLGTGAGNFAAAINLGTGAFGPQSVAVGDFNADGLTDLAVANLAHTVSILLGTGTGSFGAVTNLATRSSFFSVAVADFNADGSPDLALDSNDQNSISILLNTCTPLAQGSPCNSSGDCASGFCVDGVCCNSTCGGGLATDCQACSVGTGAAVDGTCGPTASSTICRASTGTCDPAEACNGSSLTCPADTLASQNAQPIGCSGALACNSTGNCVLTSGQTCNLNTQCASDICSGGSCLASTPTATPTVTPSATPTVTPTATATQTPTPACPQVDLGSALPVSVSGSTTGRANQATGASCGGGGNDAPDAEYQWTAPASGAYVIDTLGSSFDTILYVRQASCAGAELGCNDDFGVSIQSSKVLALSAGQTIVIVVDGYGSGNGAYNLHIDTAGSCPLVPDMGCAGAAKGKVSLKSGTANKLGWSWSKGIPDVAQNDFGSPVSGGTGYRLCVYDESGDTPQLAMGAAIPGGGTCNGKPCWKALGTTGWSYGDKSGANGGIVKIGLKGGTAGRSAIKLAGSGASLQLPTPVSGTKYFNEDSAVIVELSRDDAANCWSSTFSVGGTSLNAGTQFKAKAP